MSNRGRKSVDRPAIRTSQVVDKRTRKLSTHHNSMFKWQMYCVVGALQIPNDVPLYFDGEYLPLIGQMYNSEEMLATALEEWEELGLKKSFVKACKDHPVATGCFGLAIDDKKTKKGLTSHLNGVWVKETNRKLRSKGYKVDCFLWDWHTLAGKKRKILIRFHKTK